MARHSRTVKDFRVRKKYTSSSACSVYMAEALPSRTMVTLKVFTTEKMSPMDRHLMAREVYVHSQLDHENIVDLVRPTEAAAAGDGGSTLLLCPSCPLCPSMHSVFCHTRLTNFLWCWCRFQYGVVEDRQTVCMIMEHVAGGDLRQSLKSAPGHRLSEEEARAVGLQLLSALAYLHGKGIIHRDVKPENILIDGSKDGVPRRYKLMDFGLSIDVSKERPVSPVGTLAFLAPEVARCPCKSRPSANKKDETLFYGSEADIWAVGLVVLQLVTGRLPGAGNSPANGRDGVADELQLPDTGLSPCLRRFLERSNAKWPSDRPKAAVLRLDPWMRAPKTSLS